MFLIGIIHHIEYFVIRYLKDYEHMQAVGPEIAHMIVLCLSYLYHCRAFFSARVKVEKT